MNRLALYELERIPWVIPRTLVHGLQVLDNSDNSAIVQKVLHKCEDILTVLQGTPCRQQPVHHARTGITYRGCRLDAATGGGAGRVEGRDHNFDRDLEDTVGAVLRFPDSNGNLTIANRNTA